MSRVMKIAPGERVFERAYYTLLEVDREGKVPLQWTFGRDVWNRLRREATAGGMPSLIEETFYDLPFVVNGAAPADLLELDAF